MASAGLYELFDELDDEPGPGGGLGAAAKFSAPSLFACERRRRVGTTVGVLCCARMKRHGMLCCRLALVMAALQMGCTDWTAIRPTELPRLNQSSRQVVETTSDVTIIATTNIAVEQPDGRTVMIRGEVQSARIQTGAIATRVGAPGIGDLDEGGLRVGGSNVAPATFLVGDVDRVEVETRNTLKSTFFAMAIALVLGGAITTAVYVGIK